MIIILHGDHIVESRNRLAQLKSDAKQHAHEIIDIDGTKTDIAELTQALESRSLFNDTKSIFIENLLSNLRPGKTRDEIINYVVNQPWTAPDEGERYQTQLILWEKKSVGRQIMKLKKQQHVTVEEFKMPIVIFNFTDNLFPNNQHMAMNNLHKTLESNLAPELIFSMIIRQFRLMLAASTQADISEMKRLAPWQKGKLAKQAQQFSLEKLKKHFKELLIIDFQIKTGQSPLDLTKRIEQFIMGL